MSVYMECSRLRPGHTRSRRQQTWSDSLSVQVPGEMDPTEVVRGDSARAGDWSVVQAAASGCIAAPGPRSWVWSLRTSGSGLRASPASRLSGTYAHVLVG